MKNPNSFFYRHLATLKARWMAEDYPGGEARFQIKALGKDLGLFFVVSVLPFLAWHTLSEAVSTPRRTPIRTISSDIPRIDPSKSQVVEFRNGFLSSGARAATKRAPGTLVRVRLLNTVEAYSAAPVHAQIIDGSLGTLFLGGTLIGDGTSDNSFDRMNITFKFARDASHENVAFPISARALSLKGTLGLDAEKKEGAFARAVYGTGAANVDAPPGNMKSMDLQAIMIRALSAGLARELGNGAEVERNRAAVLTLKPGTEFFAELTDYFPTAAR